MTELPKELADTWKRAEDNPGQPQKVGDIVVCDGCSRDFTVSEAQGGFIFGSMGCCPLCAPQMLKDIKKYGEEWYIKARCPAEMSFADFVRQYRGPDSAITVRPFSPKETDE